MVRVIILTESGMGTAAHHLPFLLQSNNIQVVQVVKSAGKKKSRKGLLAKKLRKVREIGILGALNGIRIRSWFNAAVNEKISLRPLADQCREVGIPYDEVEFTHSQETKELFRNADADLGVSLGNSFIGPSIFSIPRQGMINIHHELLPEYKNAQSVIWQLFNKSAVTGYTIHKINAEIDGGDILLKQPVPIVFETTLKETIAVTSVQLLKASAQGLVSVLEDLPRFLKQSQKQAEGRSYTTPSWQEFQQIRNNYRELARR